MTVETEERWVPVIGYDDVLRALNEAVKAKGYNHVYARHGDEYYCYNVWEGKPDCIVGHALVYLGVPIEWFEVDNRAIDDVGDVCKSLFLQDTFEFTHTARMMLGQVQSDQDGGMTWGEAVTRAHLGEEWFLSLDLHLDAA